MFFDWQTERTAGIVCEGVLKLGDFDCLLDPDKLAFVIRIGHEAAIYIGAMSN